MKNGWLSLLLEQYDYGVGFFVQPFGYVLEFTLEFSRLAGLYQVGCLEGEAGQRRVPGG